MEQQEQKLPFKRQLEALINSHSIENQSNTPDWLLTEFIMDCLSAFNRTAIKRDELREWYSESDIKKIVCNCIKKESAIELGSKGTVSIVYNFNQPPNPVDCELLAIYKDGRIVVQCYDIHGEKWESETFSRIEFFNPKVESKPKEVCPKCNWPIAEYNDNGIFECYWCGEVEKANDCLNVDSSTTVSVGKKLKETDD